MVEDGLSKAQVQRKKRHERETCINNLKLNVNLSHHRNPRPVDNTTYTKRPKEKLKRGSLENVSSNPWGELQVQEQSSLRRSRSLAISRESIFTSFDFPRGNAHSRQRRSQLIPRAKLIDRSVPREQPRHKENLDESRSSVIKRNTSINKEPNQRQSQVKKKKEDDDLQGLSLPNYYPDSKCDTDVTDNISFVSLDTNNNIVDSNSNLSQTLQSLNDFDSIPYDENIVLSPTKAYLDNHYGKPRTIRGPTPYHENYTYNKRRNSIKKASYQKPNPEEDDIQVEYFATETDSNLDEITAKVLEVHEGESNYPNIENNPVYGKIQTSKPEESLRIEVPGDDNSDQYKSIVTVEEEDTKSKQHSHNYLREFLETQKGSKKPLQNFIAKKLSNLSRRSSKESNNLTDNQFHSLPDISVSENLKKCEKIDRKLRQCNNSQNRFIVNIGRHFDVTANTGVPVDFEVKIAKVPKSKKNKTDEQLIEAVKSLKQTLSASSMSLDEDCWRKPEIVEFKTKEDLDFDKDRETQEVEMESTKEYKEKVDTMRNYWGKIVDQDDVDNNCKIVDVQTKVVDVKKKFEGGEKKEEPVNKVQLVKKMFEVRHPPEKVEKISPSIKETCSYFEKPSKHIHYDNGQLESLNPNIVEIINKQEQEENENKRQCETVNKVLLKRQSKPLSKSNSVSYPEFDHVRYKVVKSDLFQKKIFANCDKESQFDGLMQYLKDYSFQELLIDNNIVIIEPIRSKVQYDPKPSKKTSTNVTHLLQKNQDGDTNSLRKHFFYHPIRVNKEVNDDELPNPDTVRQVRQFFEGGLKRSQSNQEIEHSGKEKIDPDKDHCSATDSNSNPSNISDFGSQDNLFDFIEGENCCNQQYVSEDILEKIREYGSTVTYYGGRVVKQQSGQPVLTKVIMKEIKDNEKKLDNQPVKFKLVKSNSCSSRLELVGTKNLTESKKKFFTKHKKLLNERNQKNEKNASIKEELNEDISISDKNAINECIRQNSTPKIIGEERKMTQWGDVKKDKIYPTITYSDKTNQKTLYDYHNYDKINTKLHKEEMEFEPYEVA